MTSAQACLTIVFYLWVILCEKEDDTMIISILHTIELVCYRVLYCILFGCLNSYFYEMYTVLWGKQLSDIHYVCASPFLSDDFIQVWYVKSPICMRLDCGESAAVALAAEVFSFF